MFKSFTNDAFGARLMPYLRRHKPMFAELFLCGILVNFFALSLPLFSSYIYDKVLGNGITATMWALAIAMLCLITIEWSVRAIRVVLAERFACESERHIDNHIVGGLLATRINTLPPIGRVIEKYKQLLYYRDFLSSQYVLAIADVPFMLLFAAAILLAAGPLVLVGLIGGGLLLLSQWLLLPIALAYETKSRAGAERRLEQMADMLTAREAIVGGAMEAALTHHWRQHSEVAVVAASKARFWRGMAMTIGNSISMIAYVSVLVGGVYMVEHHMLTSGGLLAASMLSSRLLAGFSSLAMILLRYHEFRRAMEEMRGILPDAQPVTVAHPPRGRLLGQVSLQHVICRLQPGQHPVLNDLSLNITPGEIVGIAGAPGAGKTTLLRLIAGQLDPEQGNVLIDQIPLTSLSAADIAQTIGYKPQDPSLMEGTIEENISAGRGAMSPLQRNQILELSGLARSFHEHGLNWTTPVGPRGIQLSGGQRQLVALARAMLHQPSVLLLDEPTTGLDQPLEQHIARQIMQLRGQATVIISTHSPQLLGICDRIMVVGQGKLLANGPRDKILVAS